LINFHLSAANSQINFVVASRAHFKHGLVHVLLQLKIQSLLQLKIQSLLQLKIQSLLQLKIQSLLQLKIVTAAVENTVAVDRQPSAWLECCCGLLKRYMLNFFDAGQKSHAGGDENYNIKLHEDHKSKLVN
jgi:hypothetical protein